MRQGSKAAVDLLRSYAQLLTRLGFNVQYQCRGARVIISAPPPPERKVKMKN